MRRSGFVCRPCLALIRKQQGQAPTLAHTLPRTTLHIAASRTSPSAFALQSSNRTLTTTSTVPSSNEPTASSPISKPDSPVRSTPPLLADSKDPKAPLEFEDISPETDAEWKELEDYVIAYDNQRKAEDHTHTSTLEKYLAHQHTVFASEEQRTIERRFRVRWDAWFIRFKELGLPKASPEEQAKNIRRGSSGLLFKQLLACASSVEDIRAKWLESTLENRFQRWPSIMTKCLRYAPDKIPEMLEATFEQGPSRGYMVRDVIAFSAHRLHYYGKFRQRPFADALTSALLHVFRNSRMRFVRLKQHTIFSIIKFASIEKVDELLRELRDYDHPISLNTNLHFANRLAETQEYRMVSLDLLSEMVHSGELDINSTLGSALATSLLSIPNKDPGGKKGRVRATLPPAQRVKIYETLLDLGLNPNIINFTAILQNLCESGELGTAWDVYDLMKGQGFEMDGMVYSVLLRGSKIAEDFVSSGRVIEKVKEQGIHNPIIWNDVLHNIFWSALTYTQKARIKPPRVVPVFPLMLVAYTKFFDTAPLQRLMTTDMKSHSSGLAAGFGIGHSGGPLWSWVKRVWPLAVSLPNNYAILKPGMDTLFIMLLGYVKGFSKPYSIIAFYSHFRNLLKSGDPLAVQFVQETGPMLYNVIIKALCEYDAMLRVALDVLSDMLKDASASASAPHSSEGGGEEEEEEVTHRHPNPDVFTWSILLNGFMFHRQMKQGERILQMMREHGITPNTATWNQLLQGYSRAQKPGKTVGVLERMEKFGIVPDEFTTRAFSYLRNRESAVQLMSVMALKRRKLKEDNKEMLGGLYPDGGQGGDDGGADEAANEYRQLEVELEEVARGMKQPTMDDENLQKLVKEVDGVWSVRSI